MAKLTIDVRAPGSVKSGGPFSTAVLVDGGPHGASVSVRLRQTAGKPPFFEGTKEEGDVTLDGNGSGEAIFAVTLVADPGTTSDATLSASASDAASTHYSRDSKQVEVEG